MMKQFLITVVTAGYLAGSLWANIASARMLESPQSASSGATTTAVDAFVPVDEVVTDPAIPVADPEFDEVGNWVTWQLGPNAQTGGLLIVAKLDPDNGDFLDPQTGLRLTEGGRGQIIDQDLVSRDLTKNGPEWATAAGGSRLLYIKMNANNEPSLAEAQYDGSRWTTQFLNDGENRFPPEGSKDLGDTAPRVAYFGFKNGDAGIERELATRLVDYAFTERVSPITLDGATFIPGDSAILGTAPADGTLQVMLWDYDVGTVEQITFDSGEKQQTPEAWRAPELGDDEMFVVQARYRTQTIGRVYRHETGNGGVPVWTQYMQIASPDPGKPFMRSTRPFVYQGKSYISFKVQQSRDDNLGVDFYITDLVQDYTQRLVRKISSDVFMYRYDQEIYTTSNGPVIYYSEVTPRGIHIQHRMQTGL